ncbi:uncharacterized protein LOC110033823 [Phalaenopsis equestris]|uniref:uncharacterized protein LOC110033823 n=1 Tax=Phalaenopsis equestris TaxID=78828 RepID=UPI0009E56F27|nr:uncharacterized protein LOC110033823 [Phalaenopsis equestris]
MDGDEMTFSFIGFGNEIKLKAGGCEPLALISASEENSRSWKMVSASYHDCSIFPPNLHEGLYIHSHPDQTLASSQQQMKGTAIVPVLPERHREEEKLGPASKSLSISAQGMIVSWFEVIRSKVLRWGGTAEGVGVGVCSLAALACVAGYLIYLRRRHRREKEFLLFLIQEKNQKIGVLLHQIAELNAVLAAHRKVPVLKRT